MEENLLLRSFKKHETLLFKAFYFKRLESLTVEYYNQTAVHCLTVLTFVLYKMC